jgi:hypothetical protein
MSYGCEFQQQDIKPNLTTCSRDSVLGDIQDVERKPKVIDMMEMITQSCSLLSNYCLFFFETRSPVETYPHRQYSNTDKVNILCLPVSISSESSPDAVRLSAVALDFAFGFFCLGSAHFPTGAPGSSSQSGQNHSPSGTASSGGSRHFR